MLNKRTCRLLGIILSLSLLLTVTGCQKKPEAKPVPPKTEAKGQKPKPPKTAEAMLKEIDKILQALDKKASQQRVPQMSEIQPKAEETPSKPAPDSSSGSQDKKAQGGSSQSGQGEQSGGETGGKTKQQPAKPSPTKSPADDWQAETMSLMKVHQSWNELEPEAIKAGMTSEDRQAFEAALDKLTLVVGQKKLTESLLEATDLYRDFGQVISYFAYPLPKDYFLVRYEVMSVMVAAFSGNWTSADQHIQDLEEPWLRLQIQLDKEQKAEADRTGYSIKDLTQAVEQKDVGLTYIKGQIVLKNLKKLEEKMVKQQQQG
ncbi:MAG: hypothetical protein ACM3O9_04060 [Methylocystaceae bacterium]